MSRCGGVVTPDDFGSIMKARENPSAEAATAQHGTRLPEIRVPGLLTLAGLVLGLLLGLGLRGTSALEPAMSIADPLGALWLQALRMTILPLVAGLLFCGIVDTAAAAKGGVMARRTLGMIVGTLAVSAIFASIAMPLLLKLFPAPKGIALRAAVETGTVPGLGDFLRSLVPNNVLTAAASDSLLPVIVFVAVFALASTRLPERHGRLLYTLFEAISGAMMVVVGWVLRVAPAGVLALGFTLAGNSGAAAIGTLAHYIVLVSLLGFAFLLGGYPLAVLAGKRPLGAFARAVLPAQVVAISTQSSLASLPAMLAGCRALKVAPVTAEFVLPLAVTLFRATSPAMNVGVAIYAAKLAGVELSPAAIAAGTLVAFLTTFGSVSLPGTISFIASVAPIAAAMGVPIWPLGILVAVEMLPDIMRTVGNVTMDVAVTTVVDRAAPHEREDQASSSISQ